MLEQHLMTKKADKNKKLGDIKWGDRKKELHVKAKTVPSPWFSFFLFEWPYGLKYRPLYFEYLGPI